MVYGLIIKKGERVYTYLKKLLAALNGEQEKYNWLISNYECWPYDPEIKEILKNGYCILSGKELTNMADIEDFQWIWGTFSAFDPSITEDEILKYPSPENDMYTRFWALPLTIQHPLAEVEIVAFDASYTLVLAKNSDLIEKIKKAYPLAEDLEEYNRN